MKESVACVAGGIVGPGVLSWRKAATRSERRNREGERWKSLLDLLPIFTWLRRQKSTASAAESPATQAKESVSLLSLLRADHFPVSSLHKSPLCQSSPPSKVIILEYKQSLVFLSLSSKTRETRKWPRGWLKARDRRGTFLASFIASRARVHSPH